MPSEWKGIRSYERRSELDETIAIILAIGLVAAALLLSGCASGSRNRDYANNCGYAMDQEGLCKSIVR
jgi:hypothetical protein